MPCLRFEVTVRKRRWSDAGFYSCYVHCSDCMFNEHWWPKLQLQSNVTQWAIRRLIAYYFYLRKFVVKGSFEIGDTIVVALNREHELTYKRV